MKKLKKAFIYIVLIVGLVFISNQYVYAAKQQINIGDYIRKVEYSDKFKKWVKLPSGQKTSLYPKIYDDINTPFVPQNPIYRSSLVGAGVNSSFSLKEKIENNLAIRNQKDTTMCWAFAGLSSLETNLALNNYNSGTNTDKVYDYSERHVNYVSTRKFLNDEENIYGINRTPSDGGQWYLVENYLTNGQGAIDEADMEFKNDESVIDISEIQNKEVQTRVYDTVYFSNYNEQLDAEKTQTMNEIKQHIQNYGSVFATIHGDAKNSLLADCYNNATGAKYCDSEEEHPIDHAIAIIGWDDDYDKSNFPEKCQPSSNGAWIARNSWGETLELDSLEQGHISVPVGDHGLMYVSYEDCNVGGTLYGIKNSSDTKDYDYIYQYNELYPALQIEFRKNSTIICNIFKKQSDQREVLNEVALTACETYNCKVYVNPNGEEKTQDKLKPVRLKSGDSETIPAGYHTLEFAEPVEITGDYFVVAIEITGTRDNIVDIPVEGKLTEIDLFDDVKTEIGRCFIGTSADLNDCIWVDLGAIEMAELGLANSDTSIKAFTTIVEDKPVVDNPPVEEDNPMNADMSESYDVVTKIQSYHYTDDSSKDYILINNQIEKFIRNMNNDSYEYYYYISPNPRLTGITNWVRIREEQNDSNKLTFVVDSRDIPNFNEVAQADTIYIYIKEVVRKGNKESEKISPAMLFESVNTTVDTYVDNIKVDNSGVPNNNNNNGTQGSTSNNKGGQVQDNTVSSTNLPNTGKAFIVIAIIMVIIVGIVVFIRYEVLNRYVK